MKVYVKPELFYERYEVSQHIADCALEVKIADENSCAVLADPNMLPDAVGVPLFSETGILCNPDITKMILEAYCYQSGAGGIALHMS